MYISTMTDTVNSMIEKYGERAYEAIELADTVEEAREILEMENTLNEKLEEYFWPHALEECNRGGCKKCVAY